MLGELLKLTIVRKSNFTFSLALSRMLWINLFKVYEHILQALLYTTVLIFFVITFFITIFPCILNKFCIFQQPGIVTPAFGFVFLSFSLFLLDFSWSVTSALSYIGKKRSTLYSGWNKAQSLPVIHWNHLSSRLFIAGLDINICCISDSKFFWETNPHYKSTLKLGLKTSPEWKHLFYRIASLK